MPKCTFCGESIKKGTGKIFVYASGKIVHFCTNKCEKNLLKLKRKPLQTKWTEAYRNEKHKSGTGKKEQPKVEKKVEETKQQESMKKVEPKTEEAKEQPQEKPVEEKKEVSKETEEKKETTEKVEKKAEVKEVKKE
jgi:large subunit ribosomal protein L24e